jgi:hypothetical protein
MGKISNPVTIKTFLPAEEKLGDITVAQYLARLAAEAVTIINAEDYGRAIYDLATRRALIGIGEDMVNIAMTRLSKWARNTRSRMPNGGCSNWPRPGATTAASSRSPTRYAWPSTWPLPPTSVTATCRASPPA